MSASSFNLRGIQYTQAMLLAIEEINNSTDLLPGISLGYKIYDICGSISRGVGVTLALTNGNEEISSASDGACARPGQVQAIVGVGHSTPSMAISTVIGPFNIPLVGKSVKVKFCECILLVDHSKRRFNIIVSVFYVSILYYRYVYRGISFIVF